MALVLFNGYLTQYQTSLTNCSIPLKQNEHSLLTILNECYVTANSKLMMEIFSYEIDRVIDGKSQNWPISNPNTLLFLSFRWIWNLLFTDEFELFTWTDTQFGHSVEIHWKYIYILNKHPFSVWFRLCPIASKNGDFLENQLHKFTLYSNYC